MGTYGDPWSSGAIPIVGTVGTGYATSIDQFLTEVQNRLTQKVPLASLQPGTFDLQNNPINNAEWLALFGQSVSPTSPVGSLQNYQNNLWWVSNSGSVQITSGAQLNTTSIGGITGDYGLGPEQFRYVVANNEYYAYNNFGTSAWSRLWALNFDVAGGASSALRVRIDATGLGGSYTLTLPTALPASTLPLVMSSSGALSTRTSVSYTTVFSAPLAITTSGGHSTPLLATSGGVIAWEMDTGAKYTFPITLLSGDIITAYSVNYAKGTSATTTLSARLYFFNLNPGVNAEFPQGAGVSDASGSPGLTSFGESGLSLTVSGGGEYYVVFTTSGASALDKVYNINVTFTRPS